MLRQFGGDFAELDSEEQKSLKLAIATFAAAYLASQEARINGLAMIGYTKMAEAIMAADSCRRARELEGADAKQGLELLLRLKGCAVQDSSHIAPTRKGDLAIMYAIGSAMRDDGRNN